MESRSCSLLLGQLGGFLGLRKSKRVAALVTTARRTSTTPAGVLILVVIVGLALLIKFGVSRCPGRRGRGRTKRKNRESRLVATVRMLVRGVHCCSKLLLLSALRELERIHLLWGDTAHGGTGLKRGHLAQLLGLQQPHANVLLVCCGNLLLLLLEQLDLLLDGQLFHCRQVQVSCDDGILVF